MGSSSSGDPPIKNLRSSDTIVLPTGRQQCTVFLCTPENSYKLANISESLVGLQKIYSVTYSKAYVKRTLKTRQNKDLNDIW